MITRRTALIVGATLALGAASIGTAVLWQGRDPPRFSTVPVTRGDLRSTVSATGILNAVGTVPVGTQVSGTIQQLFADYNSPVTKGQLIARIAPAAFEAKVNQAKADVESAQATVLERHAAVAKAAADLGTPEADIVRAQVAMHDTRTRREARDRPFAEGNLSQEDWDTAQAANDAARADLEAGQASARAAQAGVEAARAQLVGVEATVRQKQAVLVVTYDVVVAVPNSDLKLLPGMTANVQILVQRRDQVLTIPNAAFRVRLDGVAPGGAGPHGSAQPGGTGRPDAGAAAGSAGLGAGVSADSGRQQVWVLKGEQPALHWVHTGLSDGERTEIVAGLQAGDRVIVGPAAPARAGAGTSSGPRLGM